MFPGVFFFILKEEYIMNMNEYLQKINAEWNAKIDSLVSDTRKEAHDDLDQFEREIALIEQGYSAEEVIEMTKKSK